MSRQGESAKGEKVGYYNCAAAEGWGEVLRTGTGTA